MVTLRPRACKSFAREAAIIPLPNEDVTPPVTKIYLAIFDIFFKNKMSFKTTSIKSCLND